jgi:hypothetical protein
MRRIAILECEDSERWKGYTESLWRAVLWEEGDEWTVYQVGASWGGTPCSFRPSHPLFCRCSSRVLLVGGVLVAFQRCVSYSTA